MEEGVVGEGDEVAEGNGREVEWFPYSSVHEKGCKVSTGCLYSVLG